MSKIIKTYVLPLPKTGEVEINERQLTEINEVIKRRLAALSILDTKLTSLIIFNSGLHLLIGKKEKLEAMSVNIRPWVFYIIMPTDDTVLEAHLAKQDSLFWFDEWRQVFVQKFKYDLKLKIVDLPTLQERYKRKDTNGYKFALVSQL